MRQWIVTCLLAVLPSVVAAQPGGRPPTDLDRLMEDVVKRRDDNWKKLQQYILNEREKVTVTGPDGLRLFGSVRPARTMDRSNRVITLLRRFGSVERWPNPSTGRSSPW